MLTILLYHSVDDSGSFLSVPVRQFQRQMQAVARSGRRSLTMGEVAACGDRRVSGVCVTFDDGYLSVAEHAWPILRRLGLSATTYLASDAMGRSALWLERLFPAVLHAEPGAARAALSAFVDLRAIRDPGVARDPVEAFRRSAALPIMTWDTARRLAAEGMDFGGHTLSHPFLSREDAGTQAREIGACRREIAAQLGREPLTFAYPFGDHDGSVAGRVRDAGFLAACTTSPGHVGVLDGMRFELPRIAMWGHFGAARTALILSPLHRMLTAARNRLRAPF